MATLRIPGKKLSQKENESSVFKSPLMEKLKVHAETYQIEGTQRALTEANLTSISDDDIIYYTFEDGSGMFLSYDEIEALNKNENLANPNRSKNYGDEILLPIQYSSGITRNGANTTNIIRGASIIKGEIVDKIVGEIGKGAASIIAKKLEFKLVKKEGIYVVNTNGSISENKLGVADNQNHFLFIHGTNSNTTNAFNDKSSLEEGNIELDVMQCIQEKYKGRVLAFEHHTLTKSIFENVLALVSDLPNKIELTIMSHSRGGLVVDGLLLCLELSGNEGLKNEIIDTLNDEKRPDEIKFLKEIFEILIKKEIKVSQIIKVASPGGGTTLLSDNSVNLIRVISEISKWSSGHVYDEAIELLEQLIISFIKSKDNPDVLAGLEVMTPNSVFLQLINTFPISKEPNTFILAGKSSLSWNIFHSIKYVLSRLVIQDVSDMVVNTDSMTQGIPFKEYKYFLAKGSKVYHSSYFYQKDTIQLVNTVINKNGTFSGEAGVEVIQRKKIQRGVVGLEYGSYLHQEISGRKPITVVIPGMMASTLADGDDMWWIDYGDFVRRVLLDMTIDKELLVKGVVSTAYEKFCKFLIRNGHDVYTLPYDWRQSYDSQMNATKAHFEKIIKLSNNQPIRVVSHSKGGLLFRQFCVKNYELYKKLSKTNDFKWIMFGTPWYGSYAAVKTLIGQSNTLKNLRMISRFVSYNRLLKVFSRYPGVIELLPMNTNTGINYNFTDEALWNRLYQIDTDGNYKWIEPDKNDLLKLDELIKLTEKIEFVDDIENSSDSSKLKKSQIFYIAGNHDKTAYNLIEGNEEIYCGDIEKGDGTVTWLEGIPKGINNDNIYYVNTKHERLLDDGSTFENILKLINSGQCNLSKKPLSGKTRTSAQDKITPVYPSRYINSNLFEDNLNQIFDQDFEKQEYETELINVSIAHGDLKFASGPLMIGHFNGEFIANAERVLDIAFDNKLTQRFKTKVYPGAVGTSLFIIREGYKKPMGTLVVGLGSQFELTGFTLSNTIKEGILNAYYQYKETSCEKKSPFPDTWSTLLIGTAFGNLSIATSIKSIISGVEAANKLILEQDGSNEVFGNLIKKVEFIEIYQDKAYSVYYALRQFDRDGFLRFENKKIEIKPGAMNNLSIDYGTDRWNQLTIRGRKKCPLNLNECSNNVSSLTFDLNVGIAKEESKEVYINKDLIDKMLYDLIKENEGVKYWDKQISKTLFERLIPQDFKTNIRMQNNLVMNLDKVSATYPWELIQDTSVSDKPLCVTAGLIRQLNTATCGPAKRYAEGNTVLVIGDPILDSKIFNQLPGAEAEAKNVVSLFENQSYIIDDAISQSDFQIFQKLYAKPHRLIHVAAHGDFDPKNTFKSGIVIGSKKLNSNNKMQNEKEKEEPVFLTAFDIIQLDPMPEFVFINTCYSGKGYIDESEFSYRTYEFAANIGEQFIREGVKAIIVAGWPVYDDLAMLFAETFYNSMFDGDSFGQAVQNAREACFEQDPDKNTWGAYQCYGDPMYKFDISPKARIPRLNIDREILNELENLNSQAELSKERGKYLKDRLALVDSVIKEKNIKDAAILEKQAMAHYKLGYNHKANEIFSSIFTAEKATFSLKTLEQIFNVQAKIAVEEAINDASKLSQSIKDIKLIIEKFEMLNKIGKTSERFSMLGSTYKRLAYLQQKNGLTKESSDSLRNALDSYINAKDPKLDLTLNGNKSKLLKAIKSKFDCYTTHIIWQLEYLINLPGKSLFKISTYNKGVEKALENLNYYDQISEFNLAVTEVLGITDKDINTEKHSKKLIDIFEKVWSDYGAFNHLKGEYEHLENIVAFLGGQANKGDVLQKVINHIRDIESKHKTA